jgi:hypothetical protein
MHVCFHGEQACLVPHIHVDLLIRRFFGKNTSFVVLSFPIPEQV